MLQPRETVTNIRSELRRAARPVALPRALEFEVGRVAAFPRADRQPVSRRELQHRGHRLRCLRQLRQLQDIPPLHLFAQAVRDRAVRLAGVSRDDELDARRVIVGERRQPSDGQAIHGDALAHQRRDAGDATLLANDDDVQMLVGAKRIPPRADPFVAQERMRDLRPFDRIVPFRFERQERVVLVDDLDTRRGRDH